MHRLKLIPLFLVLAACLQRTPEPTDLNFRDLGTPIYSNAVMKPDALEGDWTQVAAFTAQPGGCKPGKVRFGAPEGGAVPVRADLCLSGKRQGYDGRAALPAPGRLILEGAGTTALAAPWWVIWADVDMRTLVIGTPSGAMGFILNRGGPLPADRLKAAREILEWNGYDLERLQVF